MSATSTPTGRVGCKRARTESGLSISALLAPVGPPPPIPTPAADRSCGACLESSRDGRACHACNDGAFCRACLGNYARAAAGDVALLPLRCGEPECRAEIGVDGLDEFVGHEIARKLLHSMRERERVAARARRLRRRVEFGDGAVAGDGAVDGGGAALRGGAVADGEEEELDAEELQVLKLLQTEGWQRCPDCGTGVERVVGCRHMSCVCGGQFCYRCGGRWGRNARCARQCGFDGGFAQILDGGGGAEDPQGLWDGLRDQIWRRMLRILQELHCQANRQLGTTTRLGLADVTAFEERPCRRVRTASRGISVQDLVNRDTPVEEACESLRLPRMARLGTPSPSPRSAVPLTPSHPSTGSHGHTSPSHRSMKLSSLVLHNLDFLVHDRDQPLI